MTLCVAWRDSQTVHFATDSRLTIAANSYADVGIKVLSLPLTILNPADPNGFRTVAHRWDLGMCFAGSAISSLVVKESVVELLKGLQYAPNYTDTSMEGVAKFIFAAYRLVSRKICATAIGSNGRATLLVGGLCNTERRVRVFQFSTDLQNQHHMEEVLTDTQHVFLGSGRDAAVAEIPQHPESIDYVNVLRSVINDPAVPSVGGHIQYGCFNGASFAVYGIVEFEQGEGIAHYWRGALDLNSRDFTAGDGALIPGFPYIDPFTSFGP